MMRRIKTFTLFLFFSGAGRRQQRANMIEDYKERGDVRLIYNNISPGSEASLCPLYLYAVCVRQLMIGKRLIPLATAIPIICAIHLFWVLTKKKKKNGASLMPFEFFMKQWQAYFFILDLFFVCVFVCFLSSVEKKNKTAGVWVKL